MDEEESDKKKSITADMLLNLYGDLLPPDFKASIEKFKELYDWYYDVLQRCEELLVPKLEALMYAQNPEFKGLTHEAYVTFMHDMHKGNAARFCFQMKQLLDLQRKGIDVAKEYPKLEEWRDFYCKPQSPSVMDDSSRTGYYLLMVSDEEWEVYKKEENRKMALFFEWKERRMKEYYDVVQPVLFECMPELLNLEGDFWVLYAVELRDTYEEWKSLCEEIETVMDYEMPPESLLWEYADYKKELSARFEKYCAITTTKRNMRIYGEDVDSQ